MYNTLFFTVVTTRYIRSPELTYLITESLNPLINLPLQPLLLVATLLQSVTVSLTFQKKVLIDSGRIQTEFQRMERNRFAEINERAINRCIKRRNTVTILENSKKSSLVGEQHLRTGRVGKQTRRDGSLRNCKWLYGTLTLSWYRLGETEAELKNKGSFGICFKKILINCYKRQFNLLCSMQFGPIYTCV